MYIGFRTFIGCAVFVSVIGHSVLVSGQTATTTPLDIQTGFKSVHTRPVQTLPKIVPLTLTQEQWKQRLTKEQFRILRQKGTERRGSGRYLFHKKAGTYVCSGCGNPLFESKTKYDSGSGWPSFYQYLKGRVKRVSDRSHGMDRTEIICARCDGHLGHVFSDGPPPTGERHCVNSLALRFIANPAAP